MVVSVFVELSIVIIIAVIVAGIMRLLRQPLVIGYILTGIIVSPYFFNIVTPTDAIATFAQIGIALLLFMVGLNLNPRISYPDGYIINSSWNRFCYFST
jgi:Kef-type K+ transport system membrane component KefB